MRERDIAADVDLVIALLRRSPDIEAPELRAHDAADRLLLELAATDHVEALVGLEVVVIGDTHGALTLGALALGARHVRVHQDSIVAERALAENAAALGLSAFSHHPLAEVASTDARLALVRLPRALDALDAIARDVARGSDPEVALLAAGMVKHMSLGANDVLRGSFGRLDVSLAKRKARALVARSPLPAGEIAELEPARARDGDLGLDVVAVPGAFAGASVDTGARALIAALEPFAGHPTVGSAIALAETRGLGNGEAAILVLEENIGPVRCAVRGDASGARFAEFDLPQLPEAVLLKADGALLAAALGLDPHDIGFENHRPGGWSGGVPYVTIPVSGLAAAARARLDTGLWSQIAPIRPNGVPASAYVYCRETIGHDCAFHARMFVGGAPTYEDPATGSAAAAFAGQVNAFDQPLDGAQAFWIEQGIEMGRPSRIRLELEIAARAITAARIGGNAVRVAEGELLA